MNVIEYLRRRFFGWTGVRTPEERERTARLKALVQILEKEGPLWYRPWTNEVTSELAESVFQLKTLCMPLQPLLEAFENRSELAMLEEQFVFYCLNLQNLTLESFRYRVLEDECKDVPEAARPEAVEKLFRKRFAIFTGEPVRLAAEGFRQCQRLAAIATFPYGQLLDPFTRGSRAGAHGGATQVFTATKPHFKAHADAKILVDALDDFRFLVEGLEAGPALLAALEVLDHQRSKPHSETDTGATIENMDTTHSEAIVSRIKRLVKSTFDPAKLRRVIMVMAEDPSRSFKSWVLTDDIRKPVMDQIDSEFAEELRSRQESLSESDFERKKQALFGNEPLQLVDGFDEVRNKLFAANGLPVFRRVLPLRIVKTFILTRFSSVVQPAVSGLLLVLQTDSQEYMEKLNSAFSGALNIATSIKRFEDDITSPGRSILPNTVQSLTKSFVDRSTKNDATKVIHAFDQQADIIVQEMNAVAVSLYDALETLLNDIRASRPVLASNAKSLALNQTALLTSLDAAKDIMSQYTQLIRAFSVDMNHVLETMQ